MFTHRIGKDNSKEGHPAATFLLTLDKSDVDAADNVGHTPLQYTAMKGHCDTARVLIDAGGADVRRGNEKGYLPKHWAAKFNRARPEVRLFW